MSGIPRGGAGGPSRDPSKRLSNASNASTSGAGTAGAGGAGNTRGSVATAAALGNMRNPSGLGPGPRAGQTGSIGGPPSRGAGASASSQSSLPPQAAALTSKRSTPSMRPATNNLTSNNTNTSTNNQVPQTPVSSSSASSNALASPLAATPLLKRKDREFERGANMDDAETNITVVVRCRGRNPKEIADNVGVALRTPGGLKGKEVVLATGTSALSNKTYTFDRVFPPEADQAMVYDDAVHPIIQEMLGGYNCTIFAYGQTGTGKTYTMSGDMKEIDGLVSEKAGIIPRALHNLFSQLEANESEYTVKCSFLELYNEELRDLLSNDDQAKVKIYDDAKKSGIVIQGMEERFIKNAEEGSKILVDGSVKRQVAATKCNDLSSRSHTVFTITIHAKVQMADGEDIMRTGKLNLVDLAGSESIGRSGAENKRAREAGMINQSLLTLGRVINHLVDKSQHIPYRESKLTRLLQDSLGGRTKTCIIATVSPGKDSSEETMSTLDYAARAKNIRNKPQVNQLVSKKALMKEYLVEIERLKADLTAVRQKNGIYMTDESYRELTEQSESRKLQVEEQERKLELLTIRAEKATKELRDKMVLLGTTKKEIQEIKDILDGAITQLVTASKDLSFSEDKHRDEMVLREAYQITEEKLAMISTTMMKNLQQAVGDIDELHRKILRTSEMEAINHEMWLQSQGTVQEVVGTVGETIEGFKTDTEKITETMSTKLQEFVSTEAAKLQSTWEGIDAGLNTFTEKQKMLLEGTQTSKKEMFEVLDGIKALREEVKERVGEGLQGLNEAAERISSDVLTELELFKDSLQDVYKLRAVEYESLVVLTSNHLEKQKKECDMLRQQLAEATNKSITANDTASATLAEILKKEQEQAAEDQAELLRQMAAVVQAAAKKQAERLSSSITAVKGVIDNSNGTIEDGYNTYVNGLAQCAETEKEFLNQLATNNETAQARMNEEWDEAEGFATALRESTENIHTESVKLVNAQIIEVDTQMRALDEYVSKAKRQYDAHHAGFTKTFGDLTSTAVNTMDNTYGQVKAIQAEVEGFSNAMIEQTDRLATALPTLTTSAAQPLSELNAFITEAQFKLSAPVGATPQKRKYELPQQLPKTQIKELLEHDRKVRPRRVVEDHADIALRLGATKYGFEGPKQQAHQPVNIPSTSRLPGLKKTGGSVTSYGNHEDEEMEELYDDEYAMFSGSTNTDTVFPQTTARGNANENVSQQIEDHRKGQYKTHNTEGAGFKHLDDTEMAGSLIQQRTTSNPGGFANIFNSAPGSPNSRATLGPHTTTTQATKFTAGGGLKEVDPNVDVSQSVGGVAGGKSFLKAHTTLMGEADVPGTCLDMQPPLKKLDVGERAEGVVKSTVGGVGAGGEKRNTRRMGGRFGLKEGENMGGAGGRPRRG